MKKVPVKWRGKRALLNLPGHQSTAAIVAEIEDTRGWKPGCQRNGEPVANYSVEPRVELSLSDCIRSIDLTIEFESAAARRNALYKIDTIMSALTKFRAALVEEQALYVKRERHIKE